MILALDISTSDTGVAYRRGGAHPAAFSIKPDKTHKDYLKLIDIAHQVAKHAEEGVELSMDNHLDVVVEQPFFVPGKSFPQPMFMLHGMILENLWCLCAQYAWRFTYNEVSVSTWRNWLLKELNVKAASRKSEDMKKATQEVLEKLAYQPDKAGWNSNKADAIGIWLWANNAMKEAE